MSFLSVLTKISFPGLGIGEFEVNGIAIDGNSLGFLKNIFGENWPGIAWYGIIITFGIILSAIYALYRTKQEGISVDDMLDVILITVIASIFGARIYYVIFSGNGMYTSIMDVFAIWEGGLAIYGGVIAGALTLTIMGFIKKISPLKLLDIGGSSIILGQAIGRWGNFMNVEAYGYETSLPWRMVINDNGLIESVHPTFLYESLWNIIGFAIIWYLYNHKKYDGQIVLSYLTWYGFGRMFIEGLRTDSLWLIPDVIRVSQALGALCFVCGAVALIFIEIRRKKSTKTRITIEEKPNGDNN